MKVTRVGVQCPGLGSACRGLCPAQLFPVLSPQSGRPSLKLLAGKILGIRVQQAEHCSVSVFWVTVLGTGSVPGLAVEAPCHLVADIVGPG